MQIGWIQSHSNHITISISHNIQNCMSIHYLYLYKLQFILIRKSFHSRSTLRCGMYLASYLRFIFNRMNNNKNLYCKRWSHRSYASIKNSLNRIIFRLFCFSSSRYLISEVFDVWALGFLWFSVFSQQSMSIAGRVFQFMRSKLNGGVLSDGTIRRERNEVSSKRWRIQFNKIDCPIGSHCHFKVRSSKKQPASNFKRKKNLVWK